MSLEGPLVSAILARGPEAQYNLAAFGISFTLCVLIESPVIMMMTAALSLVGGRESYRKLRLFSHSLSFFVSLAMFILLLPSNYSYWSEEILGLDKNLIPLVHSSMLYSLLWPGLIGYRRFYQGILIAERKNRLITLGTIFRFSFLVITFYLFSSLTTLKGAPLACLSMTLGVTAESLSIRLFAHKFVKQLKLKKEEKKITYKDIFLFYYPLALTTMISLSIQPMASYAAFFAPHTLESLAVLPFLNSFAFMFKALCISYQEIVISLVGKTYENYKSLKIFAFKLGSTLTFLYALLVFSPLKKLVFHSIFDLPKHLIPFAEKDLQILFFIPGLTLFICFMRSVFIASRKTIFVTYSSMCEVAVVSSSLILFTQGTDFHGALCIVLSLVLGRISACLICTYLKFKHLDELGKEKEKSLSYQRVS